MNFLCNLNYSVLMFVQPMFTVRERRDGEEQEIALLSLWGFISWLFDQQQYFWAVPVLLCSGLWPYFRLLLSSLTASPKAVLLVPAQRRRRLAILRDLGMLSAFAPCILLSFIVIFRVDYTGLSMHTFAIHNTFPLISLLNQVQADGPRRAHSLAATSFVQPWSSSRLEFVSMCIARIAVFSQDVCGVLFSYTGPIFCGRYSAQSSPCG